MTQDSSISSIVTKRRLVLGGAGTVLLGAIGSGVWQLIFYPGFGWFARFLAENSQRLTDAPYASAAMDPTPLSGLVGLFIVSEVPLWLFTAFVLSALIFPFLGWLSRRPLRKAAAGQPAIQRHRRFRRVVVPIAGSMVSLFLFAVSSTAFSVVNQAVYTWRSFNTNLARCAPYLSEEEEELLVARFRSMKTRREFVEVESQLKRVAAEHHVELESGPQ